MKTLLMILSAGVGLAQSSLPVNKSASCPQSTSTLIVVQLPSSKPGAPLSCLILNPASFTITPGTGGAPATITIGGANAMAPVFVYADAACNSWGAATVYTLGAAPNPAASLQIVQNGIVLKAGVDFTLSGSTVTFLFNPPVGTDILTCNYRTS